MKINISDSFIFRTKCNKCFSGPIFYFYEKNPVLWYNPNKIRNLFSFIRKNYKRQQKDNYKTNNFIDSKSLDLYNHSVNYKGYNPKLHKNKGINSVVNIIESLTCLCGSTIWKITTDKMIKSRPEIFNRKSKKYINKKLYE